MVPALTKSRENAEARYDGLYTINGRNLFDFCTRELRPHVVIQNDSPLPSGRVLCGGGGKFENWSAFPWKRPCSSFQ